MHMAAVCHCYLKQKWGMTSGIQISRALTCIWFLLGIGGWKKALREEHVVF